MNYHYLLLKKILKTQPQTNYWMPLKLKSSKINLKLQYNNLTR